MDRNNDMVVIIEPPHKNVRNTVSYNEKKAREGEENAKVIGFSKGISSVEEFNRRIKMLSRGNIRTRNEAFHAHINPGPGESLSDEKIMEMATELMNRLGYGNQPFLVYRHDDTGRTHYHIVSSRVGPDGKRINSDYEWRRCNQYVRDMAAKYGFEYVTADAAAGNLDCAIARADSAGVGIILHLHRKADYEGRNPERIFRKYASMGIKGVKLDFRGAADFLSSQKLEAICSAAADAGLVLDLQGVVSPGLNRKYPNVLNCGSLPDVPDGNASKSNAAGRQLGGDNLAAMWAEAARHWDCGTESRRLAEFVILDSPLAEFRCGTDSDRDSLYMDFVSSIPTAFDRTLPLEVVPGKMVVNSRKKGKLRYVAGMNSDEAAEYVLYMDKIIAPGENYKVTMFSDTEGTGEKGGYVVREFKVNAFDKIKIKMAPGGGFVMRLVPVGRQ